MPTRYSTFGIVINPETDGKIDWSQIDDSELLEVLRELNFATREKMREVLKTLRIKGQVRKKTNMTEISESEKMNVRVTRYGGQIERGQGGAPHWQMWIEVKPQAGTRAVLTALSKALYNKERSKAVSVQETGLEIDDLINYCNKEGRLELSEEFSDNVLDKATEDYAEYLERNPELKKYLIHLDHINDSFLLW